MKTTIVGGIITIITAMTGAFYTSTQSTAEFGVRLTHVEEDLKPLVTKGEKQASELAVIAVRLKESVARGNRTAHEVTQLQNKMTRLTSNSEQIIEGLAALTKAVSGLSETTAELAIITGRMDERVKNLEKR